MDLWSTESIHIMNTHEPTGQLQSSGFDRARALTELELFTPVYKLFTCSHPCPFPPELINHCSKFCICHFLGFLLNTVSSYIFMPKRDIFLVSVVTELYQKISCYMPSSLRLMLLRSLFYGILLNHSHCCTILLSKYTTNYLPIFP